jgi:site-specific recombinase XerC
MQIKVEKKRIYSFSEQVRELENKCKRRSYESNRSMHYLINDVFYNILKPKFQIKYLRNLKQKHADYVVETIKGRGYNPKVIMNKMALFRKVLIAMDKHSLVRENSHYGIKNPKAKYQDKRLNENDYTKDYSDIKKVKDNNVRRALLMQRALGLRMREASLIKTMESIEKNGKGEVVKVNIVRGAKNGRDRTIKITTNTQRKLLEYIDKEYNGKNVIPKEMNFKQWKDHFYYVCRKSGITSSDGTKPHGLRQSYAQERFDREMKRIVDDCVKNGGKINIDKFKKIAGSIVTRELGHGRLSVLVHYIEGWTDNNFLKLKYTENLNLT